MKVLRRVRGVLVASLLWGIAWLILGFAFGIYRLITFASVIPLTVQLSLQIVKVSCMVCFVWGGMSGLGFGIALSLLEGGRALAELTWRRFLLAGAVGALIPPGVFLTIAWLREPISGAAVPILIILAVSAVLGAACSAALLALARRKPTGAGAQALNLRLKLSGLLLTESGVASPGAPRRGRLVPCAGAHAARSLSAVR